MERKIKIEDISVEKSATLENKDLEKVTGGLTFSGLSFDNLTAHKAHADTKW